MYEIYSQINADFKDLNLHLLKHDFDQLTNLKRRKWKKHSDNIIDYFLSIDTYHFDKPQYKNEVHLQLNKKWNKRDFSKMIQFEEFEELSLSELHKIEDYNNSREIFIAPFTEEDERFIDASYRNDVKSTQDVLDNFKKDVLMYIQWAKSQQGY